LSLTNPINSNSSGPWWQHRWPWIILFMLSSVIVACMVTIYIAVTTRDSLVADDYSKHGRGINQRLEKDQRALELGVQAKLSYAFDASQGSELTIELLAPEPQGTSAGPGDIGAHAAFLILELSHPTMAQLDRNLILRRVSEVSPTYRIHTEPLAAAYWHAFIYPPQKDWRIRTRLDVSELLPTKPGSQAN
jgi:uncharacterized protein